MADGLLSPYSCAFVLIDYQAQFASSIGSHQINTLIKNAVDLAKTAKSLDIPTILTTIGTTRFGGPLLSQLRQVFPDAPIERSRMTVPHDPSVLSALAEMGRNCLVVAGLWTEFCIAPSVIQAIALGYRVCVVVDACGDLSARTHAEALQLMIEGGAVPMTWLQVYLELQRSVLGRDAYDSLLLIAQEHATTYGLNLLYPPDRQNRRISNRSEHQHRTPTGLYPVNTSFMTSQRVN